ncbi:hypothetical protein [Streptomyces sp. NPDC050422]|uniref:hypothetical protein n=1 Tax=Streptomyces sp. NPDC050422 TaxID=3365614 RepID=UPI003799AB6C
MKITVGGVTSGMGFGAAASLVNNLSSPYAELGMPLRGTFWASSAKVLSLLMDAGWSWAALAVAVGWLARTRVRGALVGALALLAATGAYYVTDALVSGAGTDMVAWTLVGLPFGLVLGAVGATIRRPGWIGLCAALTVPLGAAVQMIVLPPRPHLTLTPAIVLAEVIVWTAAVFGAGLAVYRFWVERRAELSGQRVQSSW